MKYRLALLGIKLLCILGVYTLSYYCFSKTNICSILNALTGSDLQTFLYVTISIAMIFFMMTAIKGDANGFVFVVCGFFCFMAAVSYSKMNWISMLIQYAFHFSIPFETSIPAGKVTVVFILVVLGCILLWLVSGWERERAAFISGGIPGKEATNIYFSRFSHLLLLLTPIGFIIGMIVLFFLLFDKYLSAISASAILSPAFLALLGVIMLASLLYIYLETK